MNGQVLISIPNVSYVHQKSSVGVVSLNWRISCLQCLLVSMKVESVGLKTEDISNMSANHGLISLVYKSICSQEARLTKEPFNINGI